MPVRAKFVCSMKDGSKNVYFNVVCTGSKENEEFFSATPGGQIMMYCLNESTLERFVIGKEYYVDFTLAE